MTRPPDPPADSLDPRQAYRSALRSARPDAVRAGIELLGGEPPARSATWPATLADALDDPERVARALNELGPGPRLLLSLFALGESSCWPAAVLARMLRILGLEIEETVAPLLRLGLLTPRFGSPTGPEADGRHVESLGSHSDFELLTHPTVLSASRTILPPGAGPPAITRVRQVRQADGLEPILRLAVLWQRVNETPLRRTQQGPLFKRDRERLESDSALVGPIADSFIPIADPISLWMGLALAVGLLYEEPDSDRVLASHDEFWSDEAVHLPRSLAQKWLTLSGWREHAWSSFELRLPVLLRLATFAADDWVAIEDLARHFDELLSVPRGKERAAGGWLEALLLGAAYPLGLIRVAEEDPNGRRVVQLSTAGRHALGLGPPPEPRAVFDAFLLVQPNFEMVAYREGVNPSRIGQLSRFACWEHLGSALQLKLTPERTYQGLEGGLETAAIIAWLERHGARPIPASVCEALRTWSGRRERVTFCPGATLMEFASPEELRLALESWPSERAAPVQVTDRLLLIEDETGVPYNRFRILGARDYRQAAEACVEVQPDGVTLRIDPGRSDLFIAAELGRLAEETEPEAAPASLGPAPPQRQFLVTRESVVRALGQGMDPRQIDRWFRSRTGMELPPAVRLLIHAAQEPAKPLQIQSCLVLSVESAELLDGLMQHPATSAYLGQRLGPTSVIVPGSLQDRLIAVLGELGIAVR